MKKLKRLWLCRDLRGGQHYCVFAGKRPTRAMFRDGTWDWNHAHACPGKFEATHNIHLEPGEGPVEVEPLRLKKARKP